MTQNDVFLLAKYLLNHEHVQQSICCFLVIKMGVEWISFPFFNWWLFPWP
jgi:hypothetical protein